MSAERGLLVYDAAEVRVGDVVAYPGHLSYRETRAERDWLRVTRIDEHGLHGTREVPHDWERDYEYVVVKRQIEVRGVEVRASSSPKEPT